MCRNLESTYFFPFFPPLLGVSHRCVLPLLAEMKLRPEIIEISSQILPTCAWRVKKKLCIRQTETFVIYKIPGQKK